MGSLSIWHWLIVLVVVLLLFGRGKIPELMGDFAKGIKNFKKGMSEDTASADAAATSADTGPAKTIDHRAGDAVRTETDKSKAS
jgi:sec-independent protein translocase protein TatA